MIKDYKYHLDVTKEKTLRRRLKKSTYSLTALCFGMGGYIALEYSTEGLSIWTQVQSMMPPKVETVSLPLPNPRTGKTEQTIIDLNYSEPVINTPSVRETIQTSGISTAIDIAKDNGAPDISHTPSQTINEQTIGVVDKSLTSNTSSYKEEEHNKLAITESTNKKAKQTLIINENTDSTEDGALANSDTITTEQQPALENEAHWLKEKIKKGDSLSKIFSRLNLSANLLHQILNSSEEAKELGQVKPGETLKVKIDGEGNFLGLILERDAIKSLNIKAKDGGFQTKSIERGLETRIAHASGTITSSLYQGAQRAGLSDQLIMELANIFGWDIDFALEIRAGDQFSLIYEDEYLDGELYGHGSILAAEFVNQGTVFRAIRYHDEYGNSNYFSPDGRSMRKAFLRAPVDFRRISSTFTKARWHPVLGKKRPHKGVDYAAETGTPIKAAGNGRVIFRGNKGGYGNTVILQHGDEYTTLYAHMSAYNNSVITGSRVKQGQTIGYVGKSGLATGPHLHYEFRVNGEHRNPLTVKIPVAAPLGKKFKADFLKRSRPLLAQLDLISRTQVATAE